MILSLQQMMIYRYGLLGLMLFLFVLPVSGFTQGDVNITNDPFVERGEVYVSVPRPPDKQLQKMFIELSVDQLTTDSVYLYLNELDYPVFLDYGLEFSLLPPPSLVDYDLHMRNWDEIRQKDLGQQWDFYPTYEAYIAMMYYFQETFPELVRIHHIGYTVMGRDLLFAEISPEVGNRRSVPQVKYTSTMHGDETAGYILSLRLIHHLLHQYGHDEQITELMDGVDIWICPNENPDGTYRDDNSTISGATRGNANYLDLNRNYPNPVVTPTASQQPETTAMINFSDTMNFILSANMHGGIELVNFPFDSWPSSERKHTDHQWWLYVMQEYVDTVREYSPAGYMTGMNDGIAHGGDWYVVYGSRQDFMNYYRSCREFTLELSNQKIPPPEQLPLLWDYNYRSLIHYMEQATHGLQGLVYDNDTGEPLAARVHLKGFDGDYATVNTQSETGYFSRPLQAGDFTMVLSVDDAGEWEFDGIQSEVGTTTYFNLGLPANSPTDLKTVHVSRDGGGRVVPRTGDILLNHGANLFLSAVPDSSHSFLHWQVGDQMLEDSEVVLQVHDGMEVRAHFVKSAEAIIRVEPTSVDFEQVEINTEDGKVLMIANDGTLPLSVDAFNFSNPAFSASDSPPFAVMTNEFVYVQLMFKPTEERTYQGELTILSNAGNNSTLRISLTGEGTLPVFAGEPGDGKAKALLSIYPNPVGGYSFARVYLGEPAVINLDVFSMDGKHVGSLHNGHVTKGEHEFPLSNILPRLQNGSIYILRLHADDFLLRERILVP